MQRLHRAAHRRSELHRSVAVLAAVSYAGAAEGARRSAGRPSLSEHAPRLEHGRPESPVGYGSTRVEQPLFTKPHRSERDRREDALCTLERADRAAQRGLIGRPRHLEAQLAHTRGPGEDAALRLWGAVVLWRRDADELHAARREPEAFSDLFDRRVLEAGRDEGDERQRAGGVARPQHDLDGGAR